MCALPRQARSGLVVTKVHQKGKYAVDRLLFCAMGMFVCTPFNRVHSEIKAHQKSHPSVFYDLVSSLASERLVFSLLLQIKEYLKKKNKNLPLIKSKIEEERMMWYGGIGRARRFLLKKETCMFEVEWFCDISLTDSNDAALFNISWAVFLNLPFHHFWTEAYPMSQFNNNADSIKKLTERKEHVSVPSVVLTSNAALLSKTLLNFM